MGLCKFAGTPATLARWHANFMFVTSHVNYDRLVQSVGKLKDGPSHVAQISVVLVEIELSRSSGTSALVWEDLCAR